MVATMFVFIGLSFATIWYLLCHYILKALHLPLVPAKKHENQYFGEKSLSRLLLNINTIVFSCFLGMLSAVSFVQFIISASIEPQFVMDHVNNPSLMFAVRVFNMASVVSLITLVVLAFIIVFAHKTRQNFKRQRYEAKELASLKAKADDKAKQPSVSVSVFDEDKKAKDSKEKKALDTESKKLLPHQDKKPDFIGTEAILGALVSPKKTDDDKEDHSQDEDKPFKTRADFKKHREKLDDQEENKD